MNPRLRLVIVIAIVIIVIGVVATVFLDAHGITELERYTQRFNECIAVGELTESACESFAQDR